MNILRMGKLRAVNRAVKATVVVAMALATANVAWGLDVQDITMVWTEEGRKEDC
jgi:hypothetical protein